MACIVCGIRPAADGAVCAECGTVLQSAVTGAMTPPPSAGAPPFVRLAGAPTSPVLSPDASAGPPPLDDVGRRYAVGDVLGERYTIVEEIGVGGMGVVYKALDRQLEKPVALKLMRPKAMDPANVARFRRELSLAQHVSHANVCRVHDLGDVEGVLFISMEHVEGQRLDHLIVAMGHLSPHQTVALGRQLCAGLRAIHEQGIIHRDLKPSNVMVNRTGHVFIMDFGLAVRPGTDKVTSTGAVLGTFAYLSPEQARGMDIGPRSDIYAVGLILYEMLTGLAPPGDDVALPLALRDAKERCPRPSDLAPGVPPELDTIVMRCLERDPGKRYGAAEEVEKALGAILETFSSASGRSLSRRTTARQRIVRSPQMRWTAAGVGVLMAVAAVFGALYWARPPAETPPVVAVAPFTNLSGNASLDSLGVGMADVLVTRLAALSTITVVSSPGPSGRGAAPDPHALARELGADLVVTGGVQAYGERIRVTLKLLRRDDRVVEWGREYEGTMSEIFDLQARLAEGVASAPALQLRLTARERESLRRPASASVEAFAQYAQAKAFLESRDVPGNVDRAIELLQSATHSDPEFALARAALGEGYWAKFRQTKEPSWTTRATRETLQALDLAPDLPQVRLSLAMVFQQTGRADEAIAELRRTLDTHPNNDGAHRLLGMALIDKGDHDAGVAAIQRAIALRPGYWEHHLILGNRFYWAGQYERAVDEYREVIRLRPESDRGYSSLGSAYQALGRDALAMENYEKAQAIAPSSNVYANIGTLLHGQGRFAAAAESYRQALAQKPNDPVLYFNLGDSEEQIGRGRGRPHYERAREMLESLVQLNPLDARALGLLATCDLELGQPERAVQHIEEALRVAPNDPEVSYRAAVVYAARGDTQRALSFVEKALGNGYSLAYAQRGDGLEPLRRLPEFQKVLEAARAKQRPVPQP